MNSSYTVEICLEAILAYVTMNMYFLYLGLMAHKALISGAQSRIKCLWIAYIIFTSINLTVIQAINLYFCFGVDTDEILGRAASNMAILYYFTLGTKWVVILFYLWKAANIFALYTCHLLKLQKNMTQGVLALHMGILLVLYVTTITRDIIAPPPSMLAAIYKMDSKSSFIEHLYQNRGEDYTDAEVYLSYTMLAKNFLIGFGVLILIDLFGIMVREVDFDTKT